MKRFEPVHISQIEAELAKFGESGIRPGVSTKDGQEFKFYVKIRKENMEKAARHLKSIFPTVDDEAILAIVKQYVV